MEAAGIEQGQVSVRTVTRFLISKRYFYLQTQKRGLMTADDHIKRVEFALYMKATDAIGRGRRRGLRLRWTCHFEPR